MEKVNEYLVSDEAIEARNKDIEARGMIFIEESFSEQDIKELEKLLSQNEQVINDIKNDIEVLTHPKEWLKTPERRAEVFKYIFVLCLIGANAMPTNSKSELTRFLADQAPVIEYMLEFIKEEYFAAGPIELTKETMRVFGKNIDDESGGLFVQLNRFMRDDRSFATI